MENIHFPCARNLNLNGFPCVFLLLWWILVIYCFPSVDDNDRRLQRQRRSQKFPNEKGERRATRGTWEWTNELRKSNHQIVSTTGTYGPLNNNKNQDNTLRLRARSYVTSNLFSPALAAQFKWPCLHSDCMRLKSVGVCRWLFVSDMNWIDNLTSWFVQNVWQKLLFDQIRRPYYKKYYKKGR